ncbi:hypothetical protein CVT26_000076 [Gymnopilus dilepis]|uniref:Uncharacterized protein n=1 Tax=Gymnopilus dilepis TaxID=231916 RepID=A0A409VGJ5_9AGAR|nr:hypothetical protein CVT26_000076 [Gymnopilus dilepis]
MATWWLEAKRRRKGEELIRQGIGDSPVLTDTSTGAEETTLEELLKKASVANLRTMQLVEDI